MSTGRPDLPSRKSNTPIMETTKGLLKCRSFSPRALLFLLETTQADHSHIFMRFVTDLSIESNYYDSTETVDTEDFNATKTIQETTTITHFICQVCHVWLQLTHTHLSVKRGSNQENNCTANDYLCHHYHLQGLSAFQCCGCKYTLAAEMQDAVVPITLFQRLQATRPRVQPDPDEIQDQNKKLPTMRTTLTTALVYIKDLLNGVKRNIDSNDPNFLARIGLSDKSQALLESIGFQMQDNLFIAPPSDIEVGSNLEQRLRKIQKEIVLMLNKLRSEIGYITIPYTDAEANMRVRVANIPQLLGVNTSLEKSFISYDEYLVRAYASFGLTSGASDRLVNWTYNKLMQETTNTLSPSNALIALVTISNLTNSYLLQTFIANESSRQSISSAVIRDTYNYFGITDEILIEFYKVLNDPSGKSKYRDKLKVFAIDTDSAKLLEFLEQENEILNQQCHNKITL